MPRLQIIKLGRLQSDHIFFNLNDSGQKRRYPKVKKYRAKMLKGETFSFEKLTKEEKDRYVIGGKDSCQVSLILD